MDEQAVEAAIRQAGSIVPQELRPRVLAAVSRELARRRQGQWRYYAGLAAGMLIALNLGLSLRWDAVRAERQPVAEVRISPAELQELSSIGLSPQEIRREIRLFQSGANLPMWRQPCGSPNLTSLRIEGE